MTSIEFDLTRADFARSQWIFLFHLRGVKTATVVLAALLVAIPFPDDYEHASYLVRAIFRVIVLSFAAFMAFLVANAIMKRIPVGEGVLGRHRVEITQDGVRETTSVNESFFKWRSVSEVVESRGVILIVIARALLLPIPIAAFSSPDIAASFLNHARDWHERGKAA